VERLNVTPARLIGFGELEGSEVAYGHGAIAFRS
jgi:hypothetical protein